MFQDLPADIQQRCMEYADTKKKLRREGIRYRLLFSAGLIVTVNEEKHIYATPDEKGPHFPSLFG